MKIQKYPRDYRRGQTHKLTDKEISQIKKKRKKGIPVVELAHEYDVVPTTIWYHTNDKVNQAIRNRSLELYYKMSTQEKKERRKRAYQAKKNRWGEIFMEYKRQYNHKHYFSK